MIRHHVQIQTIVIIINIIMFSIIIINIIIINIIMFSIFKIRPGVFGLVPGWAFPTGICLWIILSIMVGGVDEVDNCR